MKTIEVGALARVEGEGGLYIGLENGQAVEIRLDIYEPPRFFEGFLQDRFLQEVPDITARICGICPVAYQMSGVHALENLLGVTVDGPLRAKSRSTSSQIGSRPVASTTTERNASRSAGAT